MTIEQKLDKNLRETTTQERIRAKKRRKREGKSGEGGITMRRLSWYDLFQYASTIIIGVFELLMSLEYKWSDGICLIHFFWCRCWCYDFGYTQLTLVVMMKMERFNQTRVSYYWLSFYLWYAAFVRNNNNTNHRSSRLHMSYRSFPFTAFQQPRQRRFPSV